MAKLVYTYGVMGSSKTARALMQKYDLEEAGFSVLLLKPSTDTRDGSVVIKSRIGIQSEAKTYEPSDKLLERYLSEILDSNYIIVDEAQFSTKEQAIELKTIAEELGRPVYAYGLLTDFELNFFPGSSWLIRLADEVVKLSKTCACGNEATVNARYDENGIVYEGEQVVLGGNDKYKALCYSCYKNGKLYGGNRENEE